MHLSYRPLLSARKTSFSVFRRADRPAVDSSLFIWKCLRSPCFQRIVLLGTNFSAERFWWWWPWRCQRLDCVVHGLLAPTVSWRGVSSRPTEGRLWVTVLLMLLPGFVVLGKTLVISSSRGLSAPFPLTPCGTPFLQCPQELEVLAFF